jgi:hypothetical protein
MEPMRARRAPKWQLSVATVFARLRERCLELDTVPKPLGFGSLSPDEWDSDGHAFVEYSMNIRCLFNACSMPLQMRHAG